ncbi:MAG: glycine betaine/L-proline ABC transporter ATP-binding protein [Acidobacteriota bacterium]|nr:glycine betaine/L-proline ABC transporter ATP-binding protein [Acidobacteriota bacterium]
MGPIPGAEPERGEVAIAVEGLYKIFGSSPERAFPLLEDGLSKEVILERTGCVVAINDVSFRVRRGEMFVVMGLSGSGKSTVIRCLNRLIEPTRGRVEVQGRNILEMSPVELRELRRSTMSMVFQHFGLLPHRSVMGNVEFGLEISGVEPEERRQLAMDALSLVGLEGYEKSLPEELSGGMQQRVGLARALANNPEILLMDEAFSALDPLIRNQMQDELLDLQEAMHRTVVFITHDLDEALKIGDRIAILGPGGTLRQVGTPEEILSQPADSYIERFVEKVDRTRVITAAAIMKRPEPVQTPKDGPAVAAHRMEKMGLSTAFVVDSDRRLRGLVHIADVVKIRGRDTGLETVLRPNETYTTTQDTPLADLLATAVECEDRIAVLDDRSRLVGVIDRATILSELTAGSEKPTLLHQLTAPGIEPGGDASSEVV